MKKTLAAIVMSVFMLFGLNSCGVFQDGWWHLPGIEMPVNFGVKYQLEDNLYLIVVTGDKGGFEVKLEGVGQYVKEIPSGYEITSKATGLVYQVTSDENGKVSIFIVGGNGKLQPYNPPVGK